MAGQRLPTELVVLNGKKHFTKAELEERRARETDADALGRYIVAKDFYVNAVKQMRKTTVKNDPELFEKWARIQERYFKQCRSSANDLGLSISSRCKLVVPEIKKETPKENKFKKFEKRTVINE